MTLENIAAMPTLVNFTNDVSIFTNTKAIEVPGKLNSVGEALKTHTNDNVVSPLNAYVATELQPKLQGIADTLETTMNTYTANQDATVASVISDANAAIDYTITTANANIAQTIATAESDIAQNLSDADAQRVAFEQATLSTLYENTSTITGYTVAQVDRLLRLNATGVARRMAFV